MRVVHNVRGLQQCPLPTYMGTYNNVYIILLGRVHNIFKQPYSTTILKNLLIAGQDIMPLAMTGILQWPCKSGPGINLISFKYCVRDAFITLDPVRQGLITRVHIYYNAVQKFTNHFPNPKCPNTTDRTPLQPSTANALSYLSTFVYLRRVKV